MCNKFEPAEESKENGESDKISHTLWNTRKR
jgi:hypothetical protein